MSTLRVSNINNPSASAGGISIDSSGVISGSLPSPNRNLLYNGAMQIHQRGTSTASITAGGYYTADRWQLSLTTLGTWTQTIENDAPNGSGLSKSLKFLCTTADAAPAAGDLCGLDQRLEGQDLQRIAKGTSSAQQLTLSFWVKSNVTGTYICNLYDNDNTRSVSASYTISASATWEKKSITFPTDTTGAFDNDNGLSIFVSFWLAAGSNFTSGTLNTTWQSAVAANRAAGQVNLASATNNYWQITGVQLEVGPVATSFEFKSYGNELRECQRYCTVFDAPQIFTEFGIGNFFSATRSLITVRCPVPMRIVPTGSVSAVNHFRIEAVGSVAATVTAMTQSPNACSPYSILYDITHDNIGTAFSHQVARLLANNTTNSKMTLSAEL